METKITVITVTYNCAASLQATIDSVINQTYPNIEYIIVDGASTDGTLDIIKANEDKITRWISEPDKGIYDAMNKGIEMATGDYINFMNAGDSFYSLEVVSQLFNTQRTEGIVYGDMNKVCSFGEYIIRANSTLNAIDYMPFCHQSVFTSIDIMRKYKFDLQYKVSADRNFFYQCFLENASYLYIPLIVSNFEAEQGMSSNNITKIRWETYCIEGKDKSIYYRVKYRLFVIYYSFKQLLKRVLPQKIVTQIKRNNNEKI